MRIRKKSTKIFFLISKKKNKKKNKRNPNENHSYKFECHKITTKKKERKATEPPK